MNELNKELELFLKLLDQKIDSINLNLEKCQKIAGDMIDDLKKYQSGLLPDSELEEINKESVLNYHIDYDYEQQIKNEEK